MGRCVATVTAAWVLATFGMPAHAAYLGTYGQTYPIEERDMIAVMQGRARAMVDSGAWEEKKREMRERTEAYLARPPGASLPRATEEVSFLYDPSVTVPYAIRDAAGNEIYPAGTAVNPLDYMDFTRTLVLFDGDDEAQRQWVRRTVGDTPERFILVMTRGPYLDLMRQWRMRLFFDQGETYVAKFGVEHLPATVVQEKRRLRVTEVPVEDAQ